MLMRNTKSLYALLFIILVLFVWRFTHITTQEFSWDVLGYYMYLPATFVYQDPLLTDIQWLSKEVFERGLSGTLYMVTTAPDGSNMYFFLMGMAFLYLPFFLIGHFFAYVLGYPMDGFSAPYLFSMVLGAVCYTTFAFILLRKILLNFFQDRTVAVLLLFIAFATNAINHLAIKDLETVNYLFFFVTLMVYFTVKWHENPKGKYLVAIGIVTTITTLIKPSEVFIFLIPVLWNVRSLKDLQNKIVLLFIKHRKGLIYTAIIVFIICLPQMAYWYYKTGKPIYDSYKNPGVGIDWWNPHIIPALFSFRKGWLIYTPAAIFMIIGLYFLWKKNRNIALAISVYAGISFFIMVSWTEWWYGAGYSFRPVVTLYPILIFGVGYLIESIQGNKLKQAMFYGFLLLFTTLNIFQYWQFRENIIHPYRTTFEYYKAAFLKTRIPTNADELLLLDRSFSEEIILPNNFNSKYDSIIWLKQPAFQELAQEEFLLENWKSFEDFTDKDHLFVKWSGKISYPDTNLVEFPLLSMSMDRDGSLYGYRYYSLHGNEEGKVEAWFLTPELRSKKDKIRVQVWNSKKSRIQISDLEIKVYTPIK